MKASKITIHCAVTNDINQDQRMHRICASLVEMGYLVTIIGRNKHNSKPLITQPFSQKRLPVYFQKGPLFYLEYNSRLLVYLMRNHQDIIYCVDTDTLLPGVISKWLKGKKLIFDAHEYFTEVPELTDRWFVKRIWKLIEQICIPRADLAITVNQSLAELFTGKWKIPFHSIFNVPAFREKPISLAPEPGTILYQGVLNKGRGLESLIDAMEFIPNINLVLAGEGDLSVQLRERALKGKCVDRIQFVGWHVPDELRLLTTKATLGMNLLEGTSKNYYYSLANKFFDYMHAGIPSVNMKFPEYSKIISQYDIGYLLDDLCPQKIAELINNALADQEALENKRHNCVKASLHFNWKVEQEKLMILMKLVN